ncbi:MAG: MFS transporter [Alphaproteobacteria bacterium]|nr:MFS transporter [Alphaproteobacteria bacterium]MBO6629824.1 MFS transporter [Alphaproteobacteria bacterium]MDF1625737.1 MFS transporter [Parvibaculaceae bacterium]
MTHRPHTQGTILNWYLLGQASWFVSLGLQFVLFPHLVANILHAAPFWVGFAQMSLSAPAILFMLLGGATADRGDPRTILFRTHLFAAVPPLVLAQALGADLLSFWLLVIYGLFMGTTSAFAMPARDASLNLVAAGNIQKTVTLAMAVQQCAQLLGMMVALSAAAFGVPLLFATQSLIMLIGGLASRQLPKKQAAPLDHPPRLQAMTEGIAYIRRSDTLFPVVVAMFAVGVFFIGAFLVILPLLVRDFYQGGVVELGIANICFWGGTITSTVTLLRIGHVARRGRAVMCSLSAGVTIVVCFSFAMPFWLFCGLSFVWGLGAGCTMTLARTIVQTEAAETLRGRALAIFQLGFAGGAPLGSLLMGTLAGFFGTHTAMLFPAFGMTGVLAWLMLKSNLWHLRATHPVGASS